MSAAMLMATVAGTGAVQGTAQTYAGEDSGSQVIETVPGEENQGGSSAGSASGSGLVDDASETDSDSTVTDGGTGGTGSEGSGTETGDSTGDSTTPGGSTGDTDQPGDGQTENGGTDGEETGNKPSDTLSFTDVQDPAAYYYAPVYWAVRENITKGMTEDTFVPDGECTRAQIVTFLWRAAGEPEPASTVNPFTDVAEGAYYYKAVLWAVEQKITNGKSADLFAPDDICTRAQSVSFLYRRAGTAVSGTPSFQDVTEADYFYNAVTWAVAKGVTNGTSATSFSPDANCTRGQIVTFLYHAMMEPQEIEEGDVISGTFSVEDQDEQKGTFTVRAEDVSSTYGINEVRATVTADVDKDVRWYTMKKNSDGKYSAVVDILARRGFGDYTVDF